MRTLSLAACLLAALSLAASAHALPVDGAVTIQDDALDALGAGEVTDLVGGGVDVEQPPECRYYGTYYKTCCEPHGDGYECKHYRLKCFRYQGRMYCYWQHYATSYCCDGGDAFKLE